MTQLVVCIDLEQTDIRSSPASLRSWDAARYALEWWRAQNAQWPTGSNCNWFVRSDVQVAAVLGSAGWPLRALRADLEQALAAGDSMGLHPHLYREDRDGWRNDFVDVEFAEECALVALAAYRDEFGRACTTWRWGDAVGRPELAARLAALGVQFDATAEPGRIGLPPRDGGTGAPPSFVGHPTHPHRTMHGIIDWPVSTYSLQSLEPAPSGCCAQQPTGTFDCITDQWVHGWCRDIAVGRGDARVDVELLVDGRVVAQTCADWCRPDLRDAGQGDGLHGVRVAMREQWRDTPLPAFQLRPVGHDQPLPANPTDHRTSRGAEVAVLALSLDQEVVQFERAVDSLLASDGVTALTIVARCNAFVDSVGLEAVECNTRTLQAHVRAGRLSAPRTLAAAHATLASPL